MRTIPVFLGLTLALAAAALVHAEPSFTSGKPAPSFTGGKSAPSFSSERPDRTFRGGKQCVAARSVRAESAQGDDRLILHIDSRAFISHLPAPCDGLLSVNNLGKVHLQPKDGKYCAGDSFTLGGDRILSVVGLDGGNDGTHCKLGPFEGVSEMTLSEEFRR